MKGERGKRREGGAGSREIFVPVRGAGIARDLFVWSGGEEGVRGAERRGGCIAWGIGRKGREGGAGAGSRKCGRGCEEARGRCGEARGEYEGKRGDVGKRGRARKKRGKM